jgi:RNA 2',3'-cyclic 3'-phosphodiesterase
MRLFVGLPLAAPIIDELSAILARLHSHGGRLRWSASESWHITLQFLGNSNQQQCDCVVARLNELRIAPVRVRLEGLGFFDRAGVFFAGARISPELLALQSQVTAATQSCGFLPEARPFQPHITLARGKAGDRSGLSDLKARLSSRPIFTSFFADEFLLYESRLGPAGSRYEVRARFPLGDSRLSN